MKDIPNRPENQLCNTFFQKYRETKNPNYRFTEWNPHLTSECTSLHCRNHITMDSLIIRIWSNNYPNVTFDIIGHCQEAIDFAKPIMEKYVQDMTEYYKEIK